MDKTPLLMLLATAVIGVYVLPAVTARFTGTHTMELNKTAGTGRVRGLDCEKCHTYILSELGATTSATDVLSAHRTASSYAGYVNSTGLLNITEGAVALDANVNRSACMLCHLVTYNASVGFNQTHTHVTIRVCTDDQCHGAGVENPGDTSVGNVVIPVEGWASDALNVTQKLSQNEDVHSRFFNPLDDIASYYADQQGAASTSSQTGNYSKGFYACLACHTHAGMSVNLSRPIGFGLNFTATTNMENMTGFVYSGSFLNTTLNETFFVKQAGISIWT